jgi:hypothetical protein
MWLSNAVSGGLDLGEEEQNANQQFPAIVSLCV